MDRPLKEREGRDRSPKPTSASGDFPERESKKTLDIISTKCYNEYTTEEGKPHKPERDSIMKNTTYATVYSFLTANGFDNAEILAEFEKEMNRGAEAKQAKDALYATAKPIVLGVMDAPATISEIFESVERNLPEGFTKGNLQYAITRLWKDEIVKTEGKVNTYSRKA